MDKIMESIVTDQKALRQLSKDTTFKEVEDLKIISRIQAANKTAWVPGAGLAAIQIGILLRVGWYRSDAGEGILLNPVILKKFGTQEKYEGCLSIPDKYTLVERAYQIEYLTNGKRRKAIGFIARVIQHEIDHMDGILNIDIEKKEVGK